MFRRLSADASVPRALCARLCAKGPRGWVYWPESLRRAKSKKFKAERKKAAEEDEAAISKLDDDWAAIRNLVKDRSAKGRVQYECRYWGRGSAMRVHLA